METHEVIKVLTAYNKWRRGEEDVFSVSAFDIGEAIDFAIELLSKTTDYKIGLSLAGEVSSTARDVINSDVTDLSENIIYLETVLDRYDNYIIDLSFNKNSKYKDIIDQSNYNKLLSSGFFWKFYPELTGDYEEDLIIMKS